MNKNKIILCAIGGVAAVATLVIGYLTYSAWEEKEENLESLEAMKNNVRRIATAKIAPSQASVDAIDENRKNLAIWFESAFEVVSRGDRSFPAGVSQAEFRNQLREEADQKREKPGCDGGKLVDENFDFGFKDILMDGKIPAQSDIPVLQRQWDDIKFFVDTLSECGVVKFESIERSAPAKEEPAPEPPPRARGGRQPAATEPAKPLADSQNYTIVFKARPLAFVKAVNAFAAAEHFTVVDSFSFYRAEDKLDAVLGGKDKDASASSSRRGRGRRGRAAAQEEAEQPGEGDVKKKGLVIDPAQDTPFTVTMKISTYDFGTKAGEAVNAAAEGTAKEEGEVAK